MRQKTLLAGLSKRIELEEQKNENIYILTIDPAIPRHLAILYFCSYNTKLYFEQLSKWLVKTSWRQTRGKDKGFYGAPSFYSIAHAAYGPFPSLTIIAFAEFLIPILNFILKRLFFTGTPQRDDYNTIRQIRLCSFKNTQIRKLTYFY